MPTLKLKIPRTNGEEKSVEVDRTPFIVGRHSACDLSIPDGRLSREHLKIEWQTDKWVASDLGSSNGTTLNEEPLTAEPAVIRNNDRLVLGGLEITVDLEGADAGDAAEGQPAAEPDAPDAPDAVQPEAGHPAPAGAPAAAAAPAAGGAGIPTALFIIGPLLGIFVLAVVVGAVVLIGGGGQREIAADQNDLGYSSDEDDGPAVSDPPERTDPKPSSSPKPTTDNGPINSGPVASPGPGGSDVPATSSDPETARVERFAAAFIRQIAQNDPKAFLTGDQAGKVNSRIKQVRSLPSLADNLASARRNASAIKTLAEQKNLKPQFLAVAAITKLGASRGDVLQAAQSVAEVYDQLRIQIGNENFDDALLMIAAYDQGAAGETMKMRNMLQDLAARSNESVRTIRSIWFLEKNGKITAAEFERAVTFLAIGAIAQNPGEFGVKGEALRF